VPLVSVKLPDATKAKLDVAAANRGLSAHAFMVKAIEDTLENQQEYDSFMEDALRSRDEMLASGKAYDGDEFLTYLRARARGENPKKPRLKSLNTLLGSKR
jgi:predicted transcriptional regulator